MEKADVNYDSFRFSDIDRSRFFSDISGRAEEKRKSEPEPNPKHNTTEKHPSPNRSRGPRGLWWERSKFGPLCFPKLCLAQLDRKSFIHHVYNIGAAVNKRDFQKYIIDVYGESPDFPWESNPTFAVYRHSNNRKWFALLMDNPKLRLARGRYYRYCQSQDRKSVV